MNLGFGEILIILVIALLVFGPTKLPQLGEALGKGIRNFKKATNEPEPPAPEPEKPAQSQLGPGAPAPSEKAPSAAEPTRRG